jgi:predicted DNA-binding transcriptional regulator YafY
MRDAIERVFPQMEQANPGETPKRWRIRSGAVNALVGFSADELSTLATASSLMRRENLADGAAKLDALSSKLKSLIHPNEARKLGPDLELLADAEGIALRPGPREQIAPEILSELRQAILSCRKVRLHYRARGSGALSRNLVCPYGLLYGNRHYLVAYSLNSGATGFRLWALGHIEKIEQTDSAFVRRKDFSLQKYAEQSFGVFQEKPFDVVWRFSPKAAPDAKTFLFHPTQVMEPQPDGSLIVRFHAGGALEMCWHLVTWGGEVEVLAPKRLQMMLGKIRHA